MGYSLIKNFSGNYKFGAYTHKHFNEKSDIIDSLQMKDNYGFYVVGDQVLFENETGKQFSVFVQASVSPNRKNENWYYSGLGFNYKGLFTKRIDDIFGFAVAHAGFNKNELTSETTLELTYSAQITENIFIQPDLQYIINPSAYNLVENAFAGFLRFGINF